MVGVSFSNALAAQSAIFPFFYTSMIAAAEESGKLDQILEQLAHLSRKN